MTDLILIYFYFFWKLYSFVPVWKSAYTFYRNHIPIFFIPAKWLATINPIFPFIQSQGNHLFKHVILNRSYILPLIGRQSEGLPYILFL